MRVSLTTMTRLLRSLGARWGRPKLYVDCPWARRSRNRRLRRIRALIENLPPNEVALWADEVDIHLNPRPGPDWMPRGLQKRLRTPGQNRKRYLAGALNISSGMLVFTEAEHKRSQLFIDLVEAVVGRYRRRRRIHLILDNYSIHTSRMTRSALAAYGDRVVLHFLPPFSPDENKIEALWRELHANVTRNHRCRSLEELMGQVVAYLEAAQPYPGNKPSVRRAA